MKVYFIVFKDGAMMTRASEPKACDFSDDARFFETDGNTPIFKISAWICGGYEHRDFKELHIGCDHDRNDCSNC